jgi:Hemerythrin HHE cation binding domain
VAKKVSRKQAARRRASPPQSRRMPKAAGRKSAARAAASRTTRKSPRPRKPSIAASAAATVKGALAGAVHAVTTRLPGAPDDLDAIALLETDHRRLEALLKQGEETTEAAVQGRRRLLDTLTSALTIHELIEEKILYPALQKYPEARAIVLEGFQEHHVADLIVKELHQVSAHNEQWGAKFKVLKESIEHHIGEEEGPMFRTARGVMTRDELKLLGARMRKMKSDNGS